MTVYKVSYVVIGAKHPGAIMNSSKRREADERVQLGSEVFKSTEVFDLFPHGEIFIIFTPVVNPSRQKTRWKKSEKRRANSFRFSSLS